MSTWFFTDLMQSVADRGRALIGLGRSPTARPAEILRLAEDLLSSRGEASGVALARDILVAYAALRLEERTTVLVGMAERFGPNFAELETAARAFVATPTNALATELQKAAEPARQELVRRLNLAPGATAALVHMREDLLAIKNDQPDLDALDRDFVYLFSSWFNRGFLVLRRIDWSTPANILEKIMSYEAVHTIADWNDLRSRLDPPDRRLYAFFHPALVDEPLIFVSVALMTQTPAAIAPVLASPRIPLPARDATTAVFYSISNAQAGLAGVSFGNFLIKQVVEELKRELPRLDTFVTLSPVQGFGPWVEAQRRTEGSAILSEEDRRALALTDTPDWHTKAATVEAVNRTLVPLAAHYFLRAKSPRGRVIDPVARFHLGNGARLERLNPLGNKSPAALQQSLGLMVNYLYALDEIEENHEKFANRSEVAASGAVRRLLRSQRAAPVPALTLKPA